MLKQLKISNFRLFDDEVTVRFRPVTVLIGRNNAGKSSIIKFLLMLQQSLSMNSKAFLDTQGDKVNLGRFAELKNQGSDKKYLDFSLEVGESRSPGDALVEYLNSKDINPYNSDGYHEISAKISYGKNFQRGNCELKFFAEAKEVLHRAMLIKDDSRFLRFLDRQQKSHTTHGAEESSKALAEEYCGQTLAQRIEAIRHISPVKQNTPRAIDISEKNTPLDYVGSSGEYALHHLRRLFSEESNEQYGFIRPHMENILNIESIKFNEMEDLVRCRAKHRETKQEVNIADFGFGVSQCLPILVQGAMMNRHTTLIVEQPEAQVHPTAQLELGSFFADLWRTRKVRSVIEMHSSNVFLRLQKLIKKGQLKPHDVSIAFFNIENNKATVNNLNIDGDGALQDGLPLEFFHQDIWEAMELEADG